MNIQDRQIELEIECVSLGVEKYRASVMDARRRDREFDGAVGRSFVKGLMDRLVPVVTAEQDQARRELARVASGGGRIGVHAEALLLLSPEEVSYITLRTLLSPDGAKRRMPVLAKHLGTRLNLQANLNAAMQQEKVRAKETGEPNRIQQMKRLVKDVNERAWRRWSKRLADLELAKWDNAVLLSIGTALIHIAKDTSPDTFEVTEVLSTLKGRVKRNAYVKVAADKMAILEKRHEDFGLNQPWLRPMICPPRPWGPGETGGYLKLEHDLIKTGRWAHTAEVDQDQLDLVVYPALNAVQATPWRINARVLDVAARAVELGLEAVLPVAPERPLPDEVAPEAWEKMDRTERGKIKAERGRVHDHNNKLRAKREDMGRKLRIAEAFRDDETLYFPHNLDFRGRAYPLPQDLHPQADDLGRSLLMFAERKRLGSAGLLWLCYHTANCYGMDKVSRNAQYQWVTTNLDDITRVAQDPLGTGLGFWVRAEEPWQFLAACMELDAAFSHTHGPTVYASSLPVAVDGSCNGLQHLSAMGLDPVGAHATNLTADPVRQDVYQIVADKVQQAVDADMSMALNGTAEQGPAHNWAHRVSRKTVKRGVMTVPYGLTDIGMRDQLIQDGWVADLDGDDMKNATYMRDLMKEAIEDTVVAAAQVMGWMQDNAEILADQNKAIEWTTPSGFRVRQKYHGFRTRRVQTLYGVGETTKRVAPVEQDPTDDLLKTKQVNSAVPNIIHSFDAAHMSLTIASARAAGVTSFAVVHDSFGTHAADMEEFGKHIRQTFVDIYEQDWFAGLQQDFRVSLGTDDPLMEPPPRGDFDIEEVKRAEFFFA